MLLNVHIKNIALIEDANINFTDGLNILTGETGAGKSILLSSVQLALGAKADKGLIRTGAEFASVTLTFLPDDEQKERLKDLDIDCEDDILVLQRRIYPNKSVCKINGENVILKTMQSVAQLLIDIHGQREHQAILKADVQEEMLDSYAMDEISGDLQRIRELYRDYKKLKLQYEELANQDTDYTRELDFARFELDEIEKAELTEGEDEKLQEQYERLSNAKKIQDSVGSVQEILGGQNNSLLNEMSMALRTLLPVRDYDEELADAYTQLSDVEMVLQDCIHSLDRYLDHFEMDASDLQRISDRLNLINHLKDKYGSHMEDIFQYAQTLSEKISRMENREQTLVSLQNQMEELLSSYDELSQSLYEKRKKACMELSEKMTQAMVDLNFEQCRFEVFCEHDKEHRKKNGCDSIAFMISLNPGEPLKPLANVASGGELSRIMLAVKTIFADKDRTGTLVFDEIDSGISGKTAWKVSEKLAVLGKEHQVICITHLPQIAAMADCHFCIRKSTTDNRTSTSVHRLTEEESITEIGRLLGTDELTDAVLQNAAEMKNMAKQTKQY